MVIAKKKECGGDRCVLTAGVLDTCIPTENQFLWKFMNSFGGKAPLTADIEGPGASYSAVVGDTLAQTVRDTCDKIPSGPR
jgi:hypothetical protein